MSIERKDYCEKGFVKMLQLQEVCRKLLFKILSKAMAMAMALRFAAKKIGWKRNKPSGLAQHLLTLGWT